MTPQIATKLAAALSPHRRKFLVISLVFLVTLAALAFLSRSGAVANLSFAAMGPLVFLPLALLCLCVWFGPGARFNSSVGAAGIARHAAAWYASLLLSVFLLASAAWPLLILHDGT